MSTSFRIAASSLMAVAVSGAGTATGQSHEPDRDAVKAFTRLVEAYRHRASLSVHTTITVEITQDGVTSESRDVEGDFLLGPDGMGVVELRGFTCYVGGGRLVMVHESTDHSYYSVPDDGSPYYALMTEFVDLPFPHLALAFGEPQIEDVVMQFHQAAPWIQPTSVGRVERDGRTLNRIGMTSDFDDLTIEYDPVTFLIESVVLNVTGGDLVRDGAVLTYRHEFEYEVYEQPLPADTLAFDPGARQRVDMVAALVKARTPVARAGGGGGGAGGPGAADAPLVGKEAPQFVLATADGGAIDLALLRGRVVVLDFWATWCGPCRKAFPLLHEVAEWVDRQDAPATIVTVNVWERGDPDQRLKAVNDFWKKQGYTLPVAMDYTDATGGAYGVTGIPTSVIIRPDGIVHAVHAGVPGDYVETMKREIIDAFEIAREAEEAQDE